MTLRLWEQAWEQEVAAGVVRPGSRTIVAAGHEAVRGVSPDGLPLIKQLFFCKSG